MEIIIIVLLVIIVFLCAKDIKIFFDNKKPSNEDEIGLRRDKPVSVSSLDSREIEKSISNKENERIKKILDTNLGTNTLMNKSEFKTFQALNSLLNSDRHKVQKYRLFCQVGLGGFIKIDNKKDFQYWSKSEKDTFWAFNHLRADFLIIDMFGNPVLVIEYQGSGHRITNSTDRDARKRYACQGAGIEHIEVFGVFGEDDAEKVSRTLDYYYTTKFKKVAKSHQPC